MDSLTLIMQIDTLSMQSDTITMQVDALVKHTDTPLIKPIVLELVSLFLLFASVLLVWWQIRRNLDWNRSKVAQELINDYNYGNFLPVRKKFITAIGGKNELKKSNYCDYVSKLKPDEIEKNKPIVSEVFNFFETLGVFIIDKLADDKVSYHYFQDIFLNYYNWFKPYFKTIKKEGREYDYAFEIIAKRWKKRQLKDDNKSTRKILRTAKR